jgi:RimJ/RimL family protein N-acetyltransferase
MDVELRTLRLRLRQPRADDAARLARLLNNFHVAGNLARVPYPYAEADAIAWLKTWRPDQPAGDTGFTIELPGEGFIGHCGFHTEAGGTVIGYWLGEPFWNRGFMTEAAAAAIGWYFEVTGAISLASGVFAFNRASLAVQKKLGFTETGSSTRHCLARKQEVRHIDTELTRTRWLERVQPDRPRDVA